MASIDELLKAYENQLDHGWHATRAGPQRVWMCVYEPSLERRLQVRLPDFTTATGRRGKGWRPLNLAPVFPLWMKDCRFRESYFHEPETLDSALAEFAEVLSRKVIAALDQPEADEHSVVALVGVGSLFKLAKVSKILHDVDGHIRGRLVVFFPGRYEANNYRMLDAHDNWNYLAVPVVAAAGGA